MKKILLALLFFPFMAHSQTISTYAGDGSYGFWGDGGPADSAQLYGPQKAVFDKFGNAYISDEENRRVRKISPDGIITTFAGTGALGFSGDGGPATAAELGGPIGLAADDSGNVYIADEWNMRIRKVDAAGIITTVAGNGFGAGTSTGGYNSDGILADSAELNVPTGVAVDRYGNIFIADNGNNRIRKVDASGMISTVAGTGMAGFSGNGGAATSAKINGPWGLCVDDGGNVYIADGFNNVIRKVNVSTGIITTVAGVGTLPPGFSGDGGPATAAQLSVPYDVAVDHGGNIYIADNQNYRVRKVSPGGIISTIAGNGTLGYSGDGGAANLAEMKPPHSVALDSCGSLYMADFGNSIVRKVTFDASCGPSALHVATLPASGLLLYPNPVITTLTISAPVAIHTLAINDLMGQLLYSGQYNTEQVQVDVACLPAGIYFVRVNGAETRRFIKE